MMRCGQAEDRPARTAVTMHSLTYTHLGGTGRVLHLAPANGFPPEAYQPLAEALAPLGQVHGFRPLPLRSTDDPATINSWHDLADDMAAAMEQHHLNHVIGIGHSLGGILSLYTAVRQPQCFQGLVLIDPVFMPRAALPLLWLMRRLGQQQRFPLAQAAARRRDRFESHAAAVERFTGRGVFTDFIPEAIHGYVQGGLRPTPAGDLTLAWPRAWEARIFSQVPIDTWDALSKVQVPLLIIRGMRSDLVIDRSWADLQHLRPDATFVEIAGGHMVPMEQPAAIAAAVSDWIDTLPACWNK
jgi:pimeloyl-ACP methyl ester carboxylesterase